MRKRTVRLFSMLWLVVMCLWIQIPTEAQAEGSSVTDDAQLLEEYQEKELADAVEALELSSGWDVMVVSTQETNGLTSQEYAEQWFDENTVSNDGVICLIDMENRELVIRTFGEAIYYLTDQRLDDILDDAYNEVSSQDYYGAFECMVSGVDGALQRGIPSDQYVYDEDTREVISQQGHAKKVTPVELIVAIVAALAAGGGFGGAVTAKYRLKWSNYKYSYQENGRVDLSRKGDAFVNKAVTQRRIPKATSTSRTGGSGRSTTHVGSGGRRSGGGSRKF